jgi:hypothetical protein
MLNAARYRRIAARCQYRSNRRAAGGTRAGAGGQKKRRETVVSLPEDPQPAGCEPGRCYFLPFFLAFFLALPLAFAFLLAAIMVPSFWRAKLHSLYQG